MGDDTHVPGPETSEFCCVNCDKRITTAQLYCSELCQEEAKTIRYIRAVNRDGRIARPEVSEAVDIKMAILLGGGYPESRRRLSADRRKAVFTRDMRQCQICGDGASEIDHIDGSLDADLNDMVNLQALCARCHRDKTKASFRPMTDPAQRRRAQELSRRIDAPEPVRPSDDEQLWPKTWQSIQAKRQR